MGDARTVSREVDAKLDFEVTEFATRDILWLISTGLDIKNVTTNMWNEDARSVGTTATYFSVTDYLEYDQTLTLNTLGWYVQPEFEWGRFTLTPGLRVDLAAAIESLPDKYREAIVLRDFEEYSITEMAETLRFVDEQMLTGLPDNQRAVLRPLLVRPLLQSYAAIIRPASEELNKTWEAQVYEPFNRKLAIKYPFTAQSNIEAAPAGQASLPSR